MLIQNGHLKKFVTFKRERTRIPIIRWRRLLHLSTPKRRPSWKGGHNQADISPLEAYQAVPGRYMPRTSQQKKHLVKGYIWLKASPFHWLTNTWSVLLVLTMIPLSLLLNVKRIMLDSVSLTKVLLLDALFVIGNIKKDLKRVDLPLIRFARRTTYPVEWYTCLWF